MSSALARLALSAYRWAGFGLYPVMGPYLALAPATVLLLALCGASASAALAWSGPPARSSGSMRQA